MFIFRPVDLLATQIAPTAVSLVHRAAMAFTSPHISVCYLAEQGILTRRFGQLTVEGLSPSKIYSLAGCSQNPSGSEVHTPSRSGVKHQIGISED